MTLTSDYVEHLKQERRSTQIAWGRTEDGTFVYIDDAIHGQYCGLFCPHCEKPLIAKNRCLKVSNHFAHAVTVDCTGESVIHYAAKQILAESASHGDLLDIPSAHGIEHAYDCLNKRHDAPWSVERQSYEPTSAAEEQLVSDDLRVDVLVNSHNEPCNLAVEIRVTNPKSHEDIEKFERTNQDSIEIDLSDVTWNVDPSTLRDIVLTQAPRDWLYGKQLILAGKQAKAEARDLARARDAKLNAYLDAFVDNYLRSNPQYWPIEWPRLSGYASGADIFDNMIYEDVERTPRLSDCMSTWARETHGWRLEGIAAGKASVEVIVGLQHGPRPEMSYQIPTLEILLDPQKNNFDPLNAHLEWHQIQRWYDKLNYLASKELKNKLAKESKNRLNIDELVSQFHMSNDKHRLAIACELADVSRPQRISQIDYAWNAPHELWKTLVWHYMIRPYVGEYINIKNIAEDQWLDRLLVLGMKNKNGANVGKELKRTKRLWYWFRDLESHGTVKHIGRQFFEVLKAPKDFVPWT